jgi:hypothetical protein
MKTVIEMKKLFERKIEMRKLLLLARGRKEVGYG